MNRAIRCRIEPNEEQKILFGKTFGCCRFIYNRMLSERMEAESGGERFDKTPAGYKKEYPWLREVDSLALCNAQLNLEEAYRRYYENKDSGHPKFKAKHHSRQSYTTNVVKNNIRIEEYEVGRKETKANSKKPWRNRKLLLPKTGLVRIRIHRQIPDDWKLKSVTISKEPSGKYYASLLFEVPGRESQAQGDRKDKKSVGIDYAMDGLAVMSDGTRADYPKYYRQAEEKLAKEQRKLSRCEKGSRNYVKQKKRVALIHEKIRNQRRDYLHKLSRTLADQYDIVGAEDIDMRAMSRSLNFGKSVMDNGYGMLRTMLEYKLEEQGGELVKVDRFFPSSKRCSCCGRIREELALSERIYRCECGNEMDRDVNAAINIRVKAMELKTS